MTAWGLTRLRERINPETGKNYSSLTEYRKQHFSNKGTTESRYVSQVRKRNNSKFENRRIRKTIRGDLEEKFPKLLRKRLEELDLKQYELAELMGVSLRMVSYYLHQGFLPDGEVARKALDFLGRQDCNNLEDLLED